MKTICLDSRLLTEMDIPAPALRILLTLASLCDETMTTTTTYRVLNALTGCNTGDINKRLSLLEEMGLLSIARTGRGRSANTYKILHGVTVSMKRDCTSALQQALPID